MSGGEGEDGSTVSEVNRPLSPAYPPARSRVSDPINGYYFRGCRKQGPSLTCQLQHESPDTREPSTTGLWSGKEGRWCCPGRSLDRRALSDTNVDSDEEEERTGCSTDLMLVRVSDTRGTRWSLVTEVEVSLEKGHIYMYRHVCTSRTPVPRTVLFPGFRTSTIP